LSSVATLISPCNSASHLHYHWDKVGQLVRLRNENNSEASFKYDPMDRLVESNAGKRGGKVGKTETFAYDGNGRLLLSENKDSKLQWFCDLAGNNTREHQHFKYMQQPKAAVFTYEYDALGLRIASTRPDGHRVSWLTYGTGLLLGVKLNDRELLNYQRDDLHREIGREQGNGLGVRSLKRSTASKNKVSPGCRAAGLPYATLLHPNVSHEHLIAPPPASADFSFGQHPVRHAPHNTPRLCAKGNRPHRAAEQGLPQPSSLRHAAEPTQLC
jgi:YD repeat-containing protein